MQAPGDCSARPPNDPLIPATAQVGQGLLLASLLFFAPTLHESIGNPVFAQSAENCPVSHVILSNPLATPEVTADSGDLRGFALSAK